MDPHTRLTISPDAATSADPRPDMLGDRTTGNDAWLARALVGLSDTTATGFDPAGHAALLVDSYEKLMGDVEVGIVLLDAAGLPEIVGGSAERIRILQRFELDTKEGPSLDGLRTGTLLANVRLSDTGDHWPRYAPMARAVGYRSVHAFPIRLRDEIIGSVCVSDVHEHLVAPQQIELGQMVATSAAIGLLHDRTVFRYSVLSGQLQGALNSRILIEQAKGVVAERLHVRPPEAFEILRRYARGNRIPLNTVAMAAIDGELGATELRPAPARTHTRNRQLVRRPA